MRILIATNAPTFNENGRFSAYAPYVKEMDIWFRNVQEVGILSPGHYPHSVFTSEFDKKEIKLFKIPFFKITTLWESLYFFILSPYIFFQFTRSFMWADHIHLRCPGNIGLIGCIVQIFFPGKPKTAKYAGNWDPEAKQPWSYKLQKWILSNTFLTRNMKVLVYGDWPHQSKNILPFFTASFEESENDDTYKNFKSPYKFLYVGNLVPGKQPLFAVELVKVLKEKNINAELHVYGDGVMMKAVKEEAENKTYIHLHGNQPREVLKKAYKEAHFLILASKSEGWPKAVAEAMFFGCIPIATRVSCVPWMLGDGSRGILISKGKALNWKIEERRVDSQDGLDKVSSGRRMVDCEDVLNDTGDRIIELLGSPDEMKRMSREAQEWSQEYTLEKFEAEIQKLLSSKAL